MVTTKLTFSSDVTILSKIEIVDVNATDNLSRQHKFNGHFNSKQGKKLMRLF